MPVASGMLSLGLGGIARAGMDRLSAGMRERACARRAAAATVRAGCWGWLSATKSPEPGREARYPSATSRSYAWTAVMRATA